MSVDASEVAEVKQRLLRMTNRTKPGTEDPNKPTLRRRAPDTTIDPSGDSPEDEDEGPPVLKRRDGSTLTDD